MANVDVSIVIPSCDRAPILLDTLNQLLALDERAGQIIVVDQSSSIDEQSRATLEAYHLRNDINWIRRSRRCIPAAMNHGVRTAHGTVILFLDDDIRITCELVRAHRLAHQTRQTAMVAGQVIQPWQHPLTPTELAYLPGQNNNPDSFRFNASRAQFGHRFMAGNVSIRRESIIALGGFDENFVGAAYRFEADFAQRLCDKGERIWFEPAASVFHLKASGGGTRSFGHHLRTFAPWHSIGRYYYLFNYPRTPGLLRRTANEVLRSIVSRQHLRAPWRIISSLCAEFSGFVLALCYRIRGRRLPLGGAR